MNKKKGMSQILTLIVAASVLMMTALTLVFMTQGTLSGLIGNSERQQCLNSVKSCGALGSDATIPKPKVCQNAGVSDSVIEGLSSVEGVSGNTIKCS